MHGIDQDPKLFSTVLTTMLRLKDIKVTLDPSFEITPENKCGLCTSTICCTYVTQQIDTPRSKKEFEYLLWQVSHKHVEIYQDDDGWYLLIQGACSHIQDDGACGIYEHRPQICRDHTNDYCEFDSPSEEGFDLYFRNYDELLKYCKKRFKHWKRG